MLRFYVSISRNHAKCKSHEELRQIRIDSFSTANVVTQATKAVVNVPK